MIRQRLWWTWCLLLATACSPFSFGTSLQELQSAGRLTVDSALNPERGIVPGQRVTLTLTVATDTWFTGGTRIGIPEVPGLVILQSEQFASNASEIRNGQSWVVQRWTLDMFPQRTGDFTVGPLPLQIQVSAAEDGSIAGELSSPPQRFSVALPASLRGVKHWVAAPEFRVHQSFNRALDGLAVGDAFEQEVVFEASDVLAMMLPGYRVEHQPGLAAYPAPLTLENSSNRGQTRASRRERISYVIERPGQFLLPATDYYWWNTGSAKLELLSLPETRIDVSGAAIAPPSPSPVYSISARPWLLLVGAGALLIALLLAAKVFLPRLPLARWRTRLSDQVQRLRSVFRPALATRLNPGSSAEE